MESQLLGLSTDEEILTKGRELFDAVLLEIEKVLFGPEIRELATHLQIAAIAGGHALAEAHIGTGKSTLCRALARAVGGNARWRQFRADMLPSEISGYEVYNPKTQLWEVRHGPLVGTNFFLADEINRATPKAQAPLLEAMQERFVSIGREIYHLEPLFVVLATLNPIEHEGTFPLPEAQLDRFLGRAGIGYLTEIAELQMLDSDRREEWAGDEERLGKIKAVMAPEDLLIFGKTIARTIYVGEPIWRYVIALRKATWGHEAIATGASPRGSKFLTRVAQITAALRDSDFVTPEDVQDNAEWILAHRIFMKPAERIRYGGERRPSDIIREILENVPEPEKPK